MKLTVVDAAAVTAAEMAAAVTAGAAAAVPVVGTVVPWCSR